MKNWKTTLFGAITALGTFLATQDGITAVVGQALAVLGPILFGLFAKDHNVTGGVEQAPPVATP